MRTTTPTEQPASSPAPVVEAAPDPVVTTVDWRGLALQLLTVVEQRPRLGEDLLEVVNILRAADGRVPRVEVSTAPMPALAPVVPAIVQEADAHDNEVFGEEDIIDPRDQPRRDWDDPDDPFCLDVPGRGIVPGDTWLDPHGEAARREARPAEREANRAHLERQRARIAALKSRPGARN